MDGGGALAAAEVACCRAKRWRKWPAGEGRGVGLGAEEKGDLGRRAADDRRNEARSLLEAMPEVLTSDFWCFE